MEEEPRALREVTGLRQQQQRPLRRAVIGPEPARRYASACRCPMPAASLPVLESSRPALQRCYARALAVRAPQTFLTRLLLSNPGSAEGWSPFARGLGYLFTCLAVEPDRPRLPKHNEDGEALLDSRTVPGEGVD